jgi:hypothetical protein
MWIRSPEPMGDRFGDPPHIRTRIGVSRWSGILEAGMRRLKKKSGDSRQDEAGHHFTAGLGPEVCPFGEAISLSGIGATASDLQACTVGNLYSWLPYYADAATEAFFGPYRTPDGFREPLQTANLVASWLARVEQSGHFYSGPPATVLRRSSHCCQRTRTEARSRAGA